MQFSIVLNIFDDTRFFLWLHFHQLFLGSRYWIGLVDEEIEGVWKWSGTDELVTFTDWNRGEPNSWTALEDCVAIAKDDQGRWYDIECDELYLPICEARWVSGGDCIHCIRNDVVWTSMRRNYVASTSVRRHFDVMCLLGNCILTGA